MLKIALQLYSLRDLMEKDFEGPIREVKKLGYDGVEFAGLYGKDPAYIKALLAELDLVALSAHVPYAVIIENPKKVLGDYAAIGCEFVAIPYLTEEFRPGGEKYDEFLENVKMIGALANDLGMTLLYHNHEFEFETIDGKYALDILYDTVPADILQTQIDTCWAHVAGQDPAAYVRKYKGRAPVVHLKDYFRKGDVVRPYALIGIADDDPRANDPNSFFEFRSLGQGLQDFPPIIEASKEAGAKWVVYEQDLPAAGKTELQSAKESIDYLKTLAL